MDSGHAARVQKVMDSVKKAHSDGVDRYRIPFGSETPNVRALDEMARDYMRENTLKCGGQEQETSRILQYTYITWR